MSNEVETKKITGEEAAVLLVQGESLKGIIVVGPVTLPVDLWAKHRPGVLARDRTVTVDTKIGELCVDAEVRGLYVDAGVGELCVEAGVGELCVEAEVGELCVSAGVGRWYSRDPVTCQQILLAKAGIVTDRDTAAFMLP